MKLHSSIISKAAGQIDFEWQKFFTPSELDRLARISGFSKRNSKQNKFSGATFFNLIVMNNDILNSQSLNDLCTDLYLRTGVKLTPQSLNSRFNSAAIIFLKSILEHIIKIQFGTKFNAIKTPFKRVLVKDSTCFQVSPDLAGVYPGSGGDGSKASIRIQFEYDLLSGTIVDLSINAFNEQDAKNSKITLDYINAYDLIIRDLAYMHTDVFTGIEERTAAYLCRLGHSVCVYEKLPSGIDELDFEKLLKDMKNKGLTKVEKKVLITQNKIPTRLFIYRLPETIVEKRLRAKNDEAKRKGRNMPSEEYRIRQHFNLIITNAADNEITINTAYEIYRLRWQIELIFKTWKSVFSMDDVKCVKQHRLECYIFSKLIILMLGWKIYWKLNMDCYNEFKHTISQIKFFKVFKKQITQLSNILSSTLSVEGILKKLNVLIDKLRLNVKKNKMSSVESIKMLLCIN